MYDTDNTCTDPEQQQANAVYSMLELLSIYASLNDGNDLYGDQIDQIMDDCIQTENGTEDAVQQVVNGTYGCVHMACIIGYENT